MKGARPDPIALLRSLVRAPSVSASEFEAAAVLHSWARALGLDTAWDRHAVRVTAASRNPGPTLLLASHLDTVPAGEGWTVDPHAAVEREGRMYGRGASDAKGSVSAMAAAVARLAASGGPARGRLVLLASFREEMENPSLPEALVDLDSTVDAAIIGEPTSLEPCVAQRGHMLVRLRWSGDQVHAGWAGELDPRPVNAIARAVRDITRLAGARFPGGDPLLGEISATPTTIAAGVANNVTPPLCEVVLDVRSTPACQNAAVLAFLRDLLEAQIEQLPGALEPAMTPAGSALLAAVLRARADARPFVSPTCSDWAFLRDADAVKLGPGDSTRSHTPDEFVSVDDVRQAADLYEAVARDYLG